MNATGERLQAVQIGMNSSDIAGTLRLYSDLGFLNAGGHMIWGAPMSIQGLPSSARGQLYWLVGKQERVQLEIFHLTNPRQRPLAADWRCCDLGWTRFGISVPDIEVAKAVLADWRVPIVAEANLADDVRRVSFRDPFVGCFVELLEDGEGLPGGVAQRHHDADVGVVYATSSVSDLDAAREYYSQMLGLEILDEVAVHRSDHEALWNLDGASSESFVVDGGAFLIEVVQYTDPVGRPRREDYTVADQGILNIAIASPSLATIEEKIDLVRDAGIEISETTKIGDAGGAYVLQAEREVELCSLAPHHEEPFGYRPTGPFLGQDD